MNNSHITFREDRKQVYLHNDEILYVKSAGDYLRIITPGRKHITHGTIKGMVAQVDPSVFVRVHRCFIVNLKKVSVKQENILIVDGIQIPIGKKYLTETLSRLCH